MLQFRDLMLSGRLHPCHAQVASGELIHLVGPNGAGKSTLLALLAGLVPGSGEIRLQAQPLSSWPGPQLARLRSYLSQHAQRAPGMAVWHYLLLHNVSPAPDREAELLRLVDKLQLREKLARPLQQLSGGEWQRVRLAAAIFQITQPQGCLLLLDEPLTGLDVAQQAAFDRLLPDVLAAGVSVIMSSHDLNHTLHHAHRVWLLREGGMIADGPTHAIMTPEKLTAVFGIDFHQAYAENQRWLLSEPLSPAHENSYR